MKYKSALVTDLSGSVGGLTASRNAGGGYFRSKVVPVDPSTSRQNAVRSVFASLASEWVALTQDLRSDWNTYAANLPVTPAFCGPMNVTGQNQFVKTNTIRHQLDLTTLQAAPTIFDTGIPLTEPTAVEITQGSPPNSFNIVVPFVSPADEAGTAGVYLGRPINESVNFYIGPYQLMFIANYADNASEFVFNGVWTAQLTEFTEPTPQDIQSLRFNAVTDDGRVAHHENYKAEWTEDVP